LSQLLSKVTVASCSFYIKCLMRLPCYWTTHSWNVLLQKSSCFQLLRFRHWYFTT